MDKKKIVEKRKIESVDEYTEVKEVDDKNYLVELRKLIKETIPHAKEMVAWNMPSYKGNKYIVHFDAYKDHVNVYIGRTNLDKFSKYTETLEKTKSGFKMYYKDEMQKGVLKKIIFMCEQEDTNRKV